MLFMECHLKNWSPKRKKIVYAAHWQGVPVSRCAQKNKDWSGKVKIMNVFKTGSFDWVTASKKRDVCPTMPTLTALKLRSKVRKTSRVELDILSFFYLYGLVQIALLLSSSFWMKNSSSNTDRQIQRTPLRGKGEQYLQIFENWVAFVLSSHNRSWDRMF